MNILIITNDLFPYVNANSGIAYTVARFLKKNHNCDVSILGYDRRIPKGTVQIDPEYDFKIFRLQPVCDYYKIQSNYSSKISKIFHFLLDIKTWRFCYNCFIRDKKALAVEYKYAIKKILKREKIDCILAFSAPTAILKALNMLKEIPPFISYKLDPWSSHYYMRNNLAEASEEDESDKKASAIIVTKPVYSEYLKNKNVDILKKLYTLNFPCLNKISYETDLPEKEMFDKNEINCVFVGNLYRGIRNPSFAIKVFGMLNEHNIKFHIVGGQYGKCFDSEKLPPNVIYHGYVDEKTANRYMKSADVLINIGNSIVNQMPSKILTYIAYGRPIVNFIKTTDCPTLEYISKYPIALNMQETKQIADNDVDRLLEFCCTHKNKRIEYDEVKDLYCDCTPDYVVSQVYSIIQETVLDKK